MENFYICKICDSTLGKTFICRYISGISETSPCKFMTEHKLELMSIVNLNMYDINFDNNGPFFDELINFLKDPSIQLKNLCFTECTGFNRDMYLQLKNTIENNVSINLELFDLHNITSPKIPYSLGKILEELCISKGCAYYINTQRGILRKGV